LKAGEDVEKNLVSLENLKTLELWGHYSLSFLFAMILLLRFELKIIEQDANDVPDDALAFAPIEEDIRERSEWRDEGSLVELDPSYVLDGGAILVVIASGFFRRKRTRSQTPW
jgi:hypothetical protein